MVSLLCNKILLAKFSLLNIEMILNGMPNTELRNVSNAHILMIDTELSFKVIIEVNIVMGITIIVTNPI
jgi:hypothetical protein